MAIVEWVAKGPDVSISKEREICIIFGVWPVIPKIHAHFQHLEMYHWDIMVKTANRSSNDPEYIIFIQQDKRRNEIY